MIFGAVFGRVTVLSVVLPLERREVHAEISELVKPYVVAACLYWFLARLPQMVRLARPMG